MVNKSGGAGTPTFYGKLYCIRRVVHMAYDTNQFVPRGPSNTIGLSHRHDHMQFSPAALTRLSHWHFVVDVSK